MAQAVSTLFELTGHRLIKSAALGQAAAETALAPLGIKPRHYFALTLISATDSELSQIELSRQLGIDQNVLVGILDDLETRALIARVRNPRDRRRHLLQLTDSGAALHAEARRVLERSQREFFSGLSADEIQQLHTITAKIIDHATARR